MSDFLTNPGYLKDQFVDQNKTAYEIADELKVEVQKVFKALVQAGLLLRETVPAFEPDTTEYAAVNVGTMTQSAEVVEEVKEPVKKTTKKKKAEVVEDTPAEEEVAAE